MKKITKLLLINWHYFEKQIIDFKDINFLTGKNSAGKSTIIDALQVVLMGETRSVAFNRAASKKSERTLKSYLIGSKGEDIAEGSQSLRGGKDFSTYIVAEFYDDIKNSYFCLGAVFDSYSDGGDEKRRFFFLKSTLPENCFIIDGYAMNIKQMTYFFKEKYPNKFETKDTNDGYQQLLLAKTSIYEKKWFTMLKKAISFEPINDIEKFITENVCEIADDIDITAMQYNILHYKRQEQIAEKFEEKLASLEKICGLYSELERLRVLFKKQKFLIDYGRYSNFCDELSKAQKEIAEYDKDIEEFTEKLAVHKNKIASLTAEKENLLTEKQRFLTDSGLDTLKAEQKNCNKELITAEQHIKEFILNTKTNAIYWNTALNKAAFLEITDEMHKKIDAICRKMSRLEKLDEDDLKQLSVKYFSDIREDYKQIKTILDSVYLTFYNECTTLENKVDKLEAEIEKLSQGIKAYPSKYIQFKNMISDGLKKKYGRDISVEFLADLIDITDEEWHNAVEGYLNTQRMDLIVPPEYFDDAYKLYKDAHIKQNIYGCRIVDTEKVVAEQKHKVNNSLADVVKSDNKYACAYIDFLLGKVTRCYDDSKIRDNRTSITKDCMLYNNFAVSAINADIYNNPYIGRNSIKKQLENKRNELLKTNTELTEKNNAKKILRNVVVTEWFLTEDYISSTVSNIFIDYENKLLLIKRIDEINDRIDKIDLFWIDNINKKIEEKAAEIEVADNQKVEIINFISNYNHEKETRISSKIPQLQQSIAESNLQLHDNYTQDYIDNIGMISYTQELSARKTAAAIANAFESPMRGTKTQLEQQIQKVISERGEYNRIQQVSFDFNNITTNEAYDKEYQKIRNCELPKYKESIEKAKNDAMEQFKSDFLYKLKNNIETVQEKINELNLALKKAHFGNDTYRFEVKPNPTYREYYDMIMSDMLISGGNDLFSHDFLNKYQSTIDSLFAQIINLSANDSAGKTVEQFSKYKTYLSFDMLSTNSSGITSRLSKSISTNSGGELQTPFYVAILASFAQIYHIYDKDEASNTLRLVIFDEAFNKMDDERIAESVKLLKHFNLQALICSPPDKAANIAALSDRTLLVFKHNYKSRVVEWTKETEGQTNEL